MNRPTEPALAPALVIAGMHRSGTSLLAGICQAAGLRIGDRLLGAYRGNEAGHFEDLDFVEWHQAVLRANGLAAEGFVAEAVPQVPVALERKAETLVAARREPGGIWGWKDPRTTLHLEFWRRIVPEARFLFVVRPPWEVVDSLFRRGDEAFRSNPPFAIQVWLHYNRLVRDFAVKHPALALVRNLSQVVEEPAAIFAVVREVLGVPLGEPPDRFRPDLLSQTTEDSRIAFLAAACPEAIALYEELTSLAGSEPARLDVGPGDRGVVTGHGFQEWSHCRTLAGRMQLLNQSLAEADDATARLTAELAEAREARDTAIRQGQEQLATLQSQADLSRRQLDDSQARLEQATRALAEQAEARASLEHALEDKVAELERRRAAEQAEHDAALASRQTRVIELEVAVQAAETGTAQLEARLRDATRRTEELARAGDHDRQALAATAAERAALDRDRTAAEARAQELESRVHELAARLAAAESLAAESGVARDDLERQLLTLEGSNSWKLTRPLRSFRRRAVSRPTDWLRRKVSNIGRRWWRSLPVSIATKQRLRQRLFTRFAPLFRWTDSYRDWQACRMPTPPEASTVPAATPTLPSMPVRPPLPPAAQHAGAVALPAPAPVPVPVQDAGVRLIAMHLPQFHRIPENDAWWGEGFTEWTNVRRGRPMYAGHEQPHVPHPDVGYYDLSDPAALERQAAMAAAHGIHGFCFYYYWFGGRRLLEKPLDEMLRSGRPNFPFCICWANENWTRTWDGHDTEILMAQSHEPAADRDFIRDVIPLLRDPRYIRAAGRPLLAIYRPESLADPKRAAATWREECRRAGIGEIHLVAVRSFSKDDPARFGFDAAIQFPPLQIPARNLAGDAAVAAVPGFSGSIHDYAEAANFSLAETAAGYRMYRGLMPAWDNTARRMERATSWTGSSPARYGAWLRATIDRTIREQPPEHRLVFVNAWNEWAEGAHLEPDTRHGYAYLDETAAALGLPSPARPAAPRSAEAPPATSFATTDSLPADLPELRHHAWSFVAAVVGGEPSRERHGFLADHTALLGQLTAAGCRLRLEDGRVVAEAGGVETPLDHRRDLADALAVARGANPEAPFAFVVLQFGRFDVTARCLESLRRLESRRPVRIVVVDNGSPADVVEATRAAVAAMPQVELVETGANLGFAGGNNVGYAHARDRLGAAFVAVINNDTRIEQADFILRCERLFRETACSVLGPDIVTPDGRRENPWNDSVYSAGEWRRLEAMYHEDRADFERTGQPRFRRLGRRSPEAEFVPNPVLQGAAIVLSPVFVHAMPTLFDERTKLYGEEFLFAVDTLLAGHFMAYSPEVKILHEEGVSTGALPSATKMRLGYENAALAAGLAAAELDSFAAACRGEPLDCHDRSLPALVAGPRRHVLVDLFFCQPGYHGGGEYGKAVFRGLAGAAAARSDVTIWAALDPALHIDPWVLAECRRLAIRVIAVRSYADIVGLVNSGRFDSFFCPAIVVYTGYDYMRRAGTRLPFSGGRTRIVGTLHDVRDLQLIRDRDAITAALVQAGWRPQVAGPGSFLAASAPDPAALAAMYSAICHDPHVDTLVTVSRYCHEVIEAECAPPPGRFVVLCSAEKDRPQPTPYHGHGIAQDGRPFALVLHASRPEKNAPSVAAAFDRLFAGGDPFGLADLRVVFVGISSLDELGLGRLAHPERFTAIPEVPPGQLEYLLERARMLVYASFNEGFGYPPVEAMRYGTPAVVAAVAAIPEVCGDAAVTCDPRDVDSIAGAILQAWHDPPARERIVSRHAAIVARQRRDLLDLVRLIIDGVRPPDHAPDAPVPVPDEAPPAGYVLRHAGWCPICEQATTFSATEAWLRDHYLCEHCHSLPRERALMVALQTRFPDWRRRQIHESSPEMRGLSLKLARECPGYVPSQYDPSTPFGTLEPGGRWRSEDLERQTFESGTFDVVITQDVFEHIFDTDAAFREVQRTLRPGGAHLLTTPLVRAEAASRRRAARVADGVQHLEPPEFHGNPMSADGSLVTWDWGYDIVDQIRACTGDEARRIMVEIPALGMVAEYLDVIVVERRSLPNDRGQRPLPRHVTAG